MPPRSAAPAAAGAEAQPAFALWNLGFRPFYLGASVFASVSILLWIAEYAGLVHVGYLRDPVWHAHEMLFGYTIAVIVGFLFTAGRNWTGQPTPSGALLAGLAIALPAKAVRAEDPLSVEAKIPLGDVSGRIDHLAIDLERSRLFVAELGNDSLGVVDLAAGTARVVPGFQEPQGLAYFPEVDRLYAADGVGGTLHILEGEGLSEVASCCWRFLPNGMTPLPARDRCQPTSDTEN